MNLADALRTAVSHHTAGRFDEADRLYTAILRASPGNADALHLSGLVRFQKGDHATALDRIRKALGARGDSPDIWMNYGTVLSDAGDRAGAREAYERALALKPDHSGALANLGTLHQGEGNHDAAIGLYRRALDLDPDQASAWTNLGLAHLAAGDAASACDALQRAADLAPGQSTFYNLGTALGRAGRLEDAAAAYEACLEAAPRDVRAWTNLGTVLRDLARYGEARAAYDRALTIAPDTAFSLFNRALLQLLTGDFAAGWPAYEERLKSPEFPWKPRPFDLPEWRGEPIVDGRLLVGWEQGVGDQVMFAACLPDLAARGIRALVECEDRLIPLFERSFPGFDFVARRTPPGPETAADDLVAHIHLGSLPGRLRPDPMQASPGDAFLIADPVKTAGFARRYRADGHTAVVGISWRSGNAEEGAKRSVPLSDWGPILGRPDIRFVSLQYGDHAGEIAAAPGDILVDPAVDSLADLDGFAAQVAAMDLVITIDNSTAHFGGALGVPTWTLLTRVPEWRWLAEGDATYWYRSMRLFRQPARGAWDPVVEAAAAALDRFELPAPR